MSFLKTIKEKLYKFFGLPGEDKKLFLEAWVVLGVMRALILLVPFKRIARSLTRLNDESGVPVPDTQQQDLAERVGRNILKAANHTPWESACLAQSLTARKMLQRRGVSGVMFLGVAKDAEHASDMKAHSWSKCGDAIITGRAGHEKFAVVGIFLWEK